MKKQIKRIIIFILLIPVFLSGMIVNAEAKTASTRTTGTLTIFKSVDGTVFDIYKVDDDETSKAIPTDNSIMAEKKSATILSGKAEFSGLELGRYLVVESSSIEGATSKVANFLVDIPMTVPGTTSDSLNYDIEVTPKDNTTYGSIVLTNIGVFGILEEFLKGSTFLLQKNNGGTWTDVTNTVLTTDDNGEVVVDGLVSGEYRFVQQSVLNGYILDNKTTYSFNVSAGDDGSTLVSPTEVTVINEKPVLKKEVVNQQESVKIGDTINYKLTVSLPYTLDRLNTFIIKDIFPEGLTYQESSLVIVADGLAPIELGEPYTTEWNEAERTLSITLVDKEYYSGATSLILTYDAVVNEKASASSDGIINQAILKYSTVVDSNYEGTENEILIDTSNTTVPVYTGGFWIEKRAITTTGELLQGAVFKLADSETNAKSGVYMTDVNGNEITLTTDSQGKASYKGITFGTYYLVEVKAPTYTDSNGETKSYNLLRRPKEIIVDKETYDSTTPTAIVVNKTGIELPYTGGMGAFMVIVLGTLIVGIGITIIIKSRNKK